MKYAFVLAASYLMCCYVGNAAPAPPVESLLERAETSIIARVVAVSEKSVTLRRTELLRGASEAELTFSFEESFPPSIQCIGTEFLLLSQGDARFGPPRSVIGRAMVGQDRWRGWIPLPIGRIREDIYVEAVWSREDAKIYGARFADKPMTLARVKELMQRFQYNPHVNDKA
jgi:hypothetical protein